jgi:predicted TIM-barrel fold metal-dependent hydrolase
MIAADVFDRHPKLQVLIVHMGGGLASIVGRLEFCWHLNYDGIKNPPTGRALHEQAVANRLFQDQHPGRYHGIQRNWGSRRD